MTTSDYTFTTDYTNKGFVAFNNNNIEMTVANSPKSWATVGTTVKVDLTAIQSVIVKFHTNSNPQIVKTISIDCSNISGERYVVVCLWMSATTSTTPVATGICLAPQKSPAWGSTSTSERTSDSDTRNTLTIFIDEIQYT